MKEENGEKVRERQEPGGADHEPQKQAQTERVQQAQGLVLDGAAAMR